MNHTECAKGLAWFRTEIKGLDLSRSGETAILLKKTLEKMGADPSVIRRVTVAAYEVEMNIATHAYEGVLEATINSEYVEIVGKDKGPGIPDIDQALLAGYSTASDELRTKGFGAGMGLPNIKNSADELEIKSVLRRGTKLRVVIRN